MAERDGAAVDIESLLIQRTERALETKFLAAVLLVLPRREAAEHLRGEGFVDLPVIEIVQAEAVALEDRRRGMHRAEPHLRRIEPGPFRIDDAAERLQRMLFQCFLGGEHQPGGAVGDLRAVAGGDVAVLAVEERPQLGERFHRGVAPHAVVERVRLALVVVERFDLAAAGSERTRGLRRGHALVRAHGEGVHLCARDAEAVRKILCGLAHQQADHRIGQSLHDADHGFQSAGHRKAGEQRHALAGAARGRHVGKPQHHLLAVEQRRTRKRIDAAGEHQLGAPGEDVIDAGVERLHAGGAVAHHGPAGDFLAAAHAERRDPADIHLVDRRRRAAEDHFIELARRERLVHEQRAARLRCEIGGREWARPILRLEERRPGTIDDIDRLHAAFTNGRVWSASTIAERPKSCGKSSTLMTLLRSASFFCHCAYSSAVIRPLSLAAKPTSAPGWTTTLPFLTALRPFSSIASPAMAATNAASSLPVASSPFGTYMPAVRRSRAAPGSSAIAAHSRLRESSGGRHGMPSGKMVQRSSVASAFTGKLERIWSIACCAWYSASRTDQRTSGRSSLTRMSS